MSLISVANLQAYCDKIANASYLLKNAAGVSTGSAVVGTIRNEVAVLLALAVGLNDADQETDLVASQSIQNLLATCPGDVLGTTLFRTLLTDLGNHCGLRGKQVNNSIVDLPSYLAYYNGGAGGNKFSSMLTKAFADVWLAATKTNLAYPQAMFDTIGAQWNAALYPFGMATKTVGGTYTQGFSLNTSLYAEQQLVARVSADFGSGSAPPSVTVHGTDDNGSTSATTWTGTFLSNNPLATLSGMGTISSTVLGQSRQLVQVSGSTSNIVPGSVLVINNNLPDQETVLVETVPDASHFTAVFQKPHTSGATITTSTAVTLAPSSGGRRCSAVSSITLGLSGHAAGTVEVYGWADRVGV